MAIIATANSRAGQTAFNQRKTRLKLHIDKHNAIPFEQQIQEQIGLAVSFGKLRNGDTLPSIRDVEKQTGVNRGLVYKAYRNLQRAGIVVTSRGKRAVISSHAISPNTLEKKCEALGSAVISNIRRLGISPISFSRYLRRRAEENEWHSPLIVFVSPASYVATAWAAVISRIWRVHVSGMTPRQLKDEIKGGRAPKTILCLFFDYERVRSSRMRKVEVIPISITWTRLERRLLAQIEPDSKVLVIVADEYRQIQHRFAERLQQEIKGRNVAISTIPREEVTLRQLGRNRYDYIIILPGMTVDTMSPELKRDTRVILVTGELNAESLEAARIRAGVIA